MRLSEFKQRVEAEFGVNLKNATPANVREFLEKLQQEAYQQIRADGKPYEIREDDAFTYEEVIKDFFARVLDMPPEEAVILLWTVAIELAFSAIEHHYAEDLDPLFRSLEEEME